MPSNHAKQYSIYSRNILIIPAATVDIPVVGSDAINATEILDNRPLLLERFEVLSILGEGAAGAVYHVRDKAADQKEVALKVLIDQSAFDEHTRRRFKEEWLISSSLVHKNLVRGYDFIELDDAVAYTMEYVEGKDLSDFLGQPDTVLEVVDSIFVQLLDALEYLHTNGVLHRDIKLENILVSSAGQVKISDLGLMKVHREDKLTRTGVLLGTAQYMPPEYIKSSHYTHLSDFYAVGVVLYELLSGSRWLADMNGNAVIEHLLKTNFSFPALKTIPLPAKYHYLLRRLLDPDPQERFQSVPTVRTLFKKPVEFFEQKENIEKCELFFEKAISAPPANPGKRTFLWPATACLALCLVMASIGFTCARLGYFQEASTLPPGYYTGRFTVNGTSEAVSMQVGSVAGIVQTAACRDGLLAFAEKTLQCGDTTYRAILRESEENTRIDLYRFMNHDGHLLIKKRS